MRKQAWKEIQNIVNEQAWFVWLPTINAKLPLRNRFGNCKPSVIPHRLIWNIDQCLRQEVTSLSQPMTNLRSPALPADDPAAASGSRR